MQALRKKTQRETGRLKRKLVTTQAGVASERPQKKKAAMDQTEPNKAKSQPRHQSPAKKKTAESKTEGGDLKKGIRADPNGYTQIQKDR
ncbi:hypothetical protein BLNAU_15913 [Blattamonas nauphoetae]|uniref:Uncharacterized protein n=1 Tax=Blattamonas nauphoetae TaxID=2049346 RepID=A0ABQ9XD23_9EUKA|nr:hypothetical protein BLNAU_15913 [Blattamonas nauphoetae]